MIKGKAKFEFQFCQLSESDFRYQKLEIASRTGNAHLVFKQYIYIYIYSEQSLPQHGENKQGNEERARK